ncbi:DsbE family thiol:disulfide interchange protein [Pseudoroseomonas ludipueritiae]|uniref:DsbE family thiol:disulfide interchange protein n=1 Tax=Pseudoroseomonas ludipueritiae TaxID=198093 RepID=A0ABR7R956_9PROT|nr:DsbE family thiol:disulfide interchange protein [Pseudoroseomonas ludipueritiae]MBC9178261.1 DsbE family thiol:disulfide interchange protein [Pseudoroseomonas ludipueritiae]
MSENTASPGKSLGRRRALMLAPLGLALAGGAGFYAMLRGLGTGSYDPRGVPSALLGKPAPAFALPPLEESGLPALSNTDLVDLPAPVLVNFWASWCVPCIVEHPQLMRLSRDGVAVLGINYKDKAGDAAAFLTRHGNPFRRLGRDEPGRAAIDWGVYGVPETYLLDRKGIIRWRWPGPVTPEVLDQDLRPLLRRHA